MHIILFANGEITQSPLPLPAHDLLVAADGGARNALRYGLAPDVVIGDFDSLTPEETAALERAGAGILRFPADKDETDLELALDYAVGEGAGEVTLYGLFGGRWDMTFANMLLLAGQKYSGLRLQIAAGRTRMHLLRGGQSLVLSGRAGERVSVLPLSGPAEGVTYTGLAWPLENAALPFGSPRGVSNTMQSKTANISVRKGIVLVVCFPGEADKPASPPRDH